MADIDIQVITNIEGLEEVEEAFTQGSRRAVKKFLRRVEMRAAKVLMESAKQFSPVLTGRLEDSIHRESVMGDGSLTVRVGPTKDAFYGLIQEFGAPEVHVPALHWLENSARAVQNEVLETFLVELQSGLEDMKR